METGRPTKLSYELIEQIALIVRKGNYIETAASAAGIDRSTLYRWLKRGAREQERLDRSPEEKPDQNEQIFVDFCNTIKMAIAESEMIDLENIRQASANDWKASAWRLERRFPNKWAKREYTDANIKSEHTDKKEVFIEQQIEGDPQTVELVRQLWRRQRAMEETQ